MDQPKIDAAAKELFTLLLDHELSEAEAVSAIAIASTMRLAYKANSFAELKLKVQKLGTIFSRYAEANAEAFEAALRAKEEALATQTTTQTETKQ